MSKQMLIPLAFVVCYAILLCFFFNSIPITNGQPCDGPDDPPCSEGYFCDNLFNHECHLCYSVGTQCITDDPCCSNGPCVNGHCKCALHNQFCYNKNENCCSGHCMYSHFAGTYVCS